MSLKQVAYNVIQAFVHHSLSSTGYLLNVFLLEYIDSEAL